MHAAGPRRDLLPDPALTSAYAARLAVYRGLNKGIAGVVREG